MTPWAKFPPLITGHQHSVPMWSRLKSLTILLCSATLIAFCAELVSDNIKSFFKSSGISEVSHSSPNRYV